MLRRERGQATLELALLLPVLLLLIVSFVEVSMLAADRARLQHAAREAARVAAVASDRDAIEAAADSAGLEPIEVEISPAPELRVQGEPVTVEVSFRPRGHLPVAGLFVRGVRLNARAVMRIERP